MDIEKESDVTNGVLYTVLTGKSLEMDVTQSRNRPPVFCNDSLWNQQSTLIQIQNDVDVPVYVDCSIHEILNDGMKWIKCNSFTYNSDLEGEIEIGVICHNDGFVNFTPIATIDSLSTGDHILHFKRSKFSVNDAGLTPILCRALVQEEYKIYIISGDFIFDAADSGMSYIKTTHDYEDSLHLFSKVSESYDTLMRARFHGKEPRLSCVDAACFVSQESEFRVASHRVNKAPVLSYTFV